MKLFTVKFSLIVSNLAQYPLKVMKMHYCRKKERQGENDGALDKERAKRSNAYIVHAQKKHMKSLDLLARSSSNAPSFSPCLSFFLQ